MPRLAPPQPGGLPRQAQRRARAGHPERFAYSIPNSTSRSLPYSSESKQPKGSWCRNAVVEIVDEDAVVSRIGQDRRIEKLIGDKPPEASDTVWRGKDATEENKLIVAEEEDAQGAGKVHPDPALRCGEREVNLTVAA